MLAKLHVDNLDCLMQHRLLSADSLSDRAPRISAGLVDRLSAFLLFEAGEAHFQHVWRHLVVLGQFQTSSSQGKERANSRKIS